MIARIFTALIIVFGCEAMPLLMTMLKIPPDNTGTLQILRVLVLGVTFGVLAASKPTEADERPRERQTIRSPSQDDSLMRFKELLTPAKPPEPVKEEPKKEREAPIV